MRKHGIEPFYAQLGKRLKEARREKKLTQEQVGAVLGVTGSTVIYYEQGKNRLRTLELVQLCSVLGINVGELLNGMVDTAPELFEPLQPNSISVLRRAARAAAQGDD